MTLQEEIAEGEYHIALRAAHPLAFAALMHLNAEIDKIRARLSPEAFHALQSESRRAVAARTPIDRKVVTIAGSYDRKIR